MTLGEKIRKYRLLKGLTQKELGEVALAKKKGADVRINQYEKDIMAPKTDIRSSIAEALDVDIEALSSDSINSDEELLYLLFELEEKHFIKINKENGRIFLDFEDPDERTNASENLLTMLNYWEYEASKDRSSGDKKYAYELWKGRFVSNLQEYKNKRIEAVDNYYEKKIKNYDKEKKYAKETSEIVRLLVEISKAGFTLTTRITEDGVGFAFVASELLSPPSLEAEKLFTRFLAEFNHIDKLGASCNKDVMMPLDVLLIIYYIHVPSFLHIRGLLDEYRVFMQNAYKYENYSADFNVEFEKAIINKSVDIEKEVRKYRTRK